eukprot:CAMPEP_0184747600 /NCGR_PEP_ID=MMETSP0315-20130426/12325_1 /TAXON_ID=101924 /ORGANISM="Rhodosorus marinus, Strain UTEX LB 2760" /LENGTH=98 /DNA_ID=CAMNT_0027221067 /DNA_START=892 /DNA_END=1188 /DNA_ORIENTATION=+
MTADVDHVRQLRSGGSGIWFFSSLLPLGWALQEIKPRSRALPLLPWATYRSNRHGDGCIHVGGWLHDTLGMALPNSDRSVLPTLCLWQLPPGFGLFRN